MARRWAARRFTGGESHLKESKMNKGKKVLVIIAARGGSKGLPGKNLKHLKDKPLVAWPIVAALGASVVDRVIVSTDDKSIADVATKWGADVPFLRPSHLASDTASSMDVVLHAIESIRAIGENYDYVILLEPTSPFTDSHDIDCAVKKLIESRETADSIVGVADVESAHPDYLVRMDAGGIIKPFISIDFKNIRRRQELESLYKFDGSIFVSDTNVFIDRKTFYHSRTLGYLMPKWKSIDIDDKIDFICAQALMEQINEIKNMS